MPIYVRRVLCVLCTNNPYGPTKYFLTKIDSENYIWALVWHTRYTSQISNKLKQSNSTPPQKSNKQSNPFWGLLTNTTYSSTNSLNQTSLLRVGTEQFDDQLCKHREQLLKGVAYFSYTRTRGLWRLAWLLLNVQGSRGLAFVRAFDDNNKKTGMIRT